MRGRDFGIIDPERGIYIRHVPQSRARGRSDPNPARVLPLVFQACKLKRSLIMTICASWVIILANSTVFVWGGSDGRDLGT